MHRGKGMTFVGDSRIKKYEKAKLNRDYSEFPGKTESFWPDFLLKEWMTGAVFLIAFLCLTVAHPAPLERVADPSDTGYTPLPDWYFLFLYQILKYTYASGPFNTFGAIVLPGIAFAALLLAPWLDTSRHRLWYKRPVASGMMLLTVAILFYTTWESSHYHDWEKQEAQGKITFSNLDKKDPAYTDIIKSNCTSCHGGELTGGAGPNLVEANLQPAAVEAFVTNGAGKMPSFKDTLSKDQIKQVAEYVANLELTDENGKPLKK
ncbi:menaquinol-cytochrome c reductase cytochrome b/c subunit [Macrococcus bovicus]|uniref:menaquinol-cytochrome c reductase cytochrome b/c subunit n=1 Tax=Macrococcus bovicus TaxID=69968 RepID=UPI0025A5F776|nr:menaquinol-cytochrome c reductase cytochrome b/c subunit [Macrococcus bovicus]WJP96847.1 c-type cytochrome [Macrococcus bovicus]